MTPRDEHLHDVIDDAVEHAGRDSIALTDHIHDAIRAAGYVKADSEEWGARLGDASGVDRMPTEFEARVLEELPRWVAVRRLVGPWEVA